MFRYRLALRRHPKLVRATIVIIVLILVSGGGLAYLHQSQPKIISFDSCIAAGYDASSSDPQTCTDGHQTFAAHEAPATKVETPNQTQQPYTLLVTEDSKGTYPHQTEVITTDVEWKSFWASVHAGISPLPPLLAVDFTKDMVLAIVDGVQPTTGYGLTFTGFAVGDNSATARFDAISPSAACAVAQTKTNPYLLVLTAKVSVPVTFEPTDRPRQC